MERIEITTTWDAVQAVQTLQGLLQSIFQVQSATQAQTAAVAANEGAMRNEAQARSILARAIQDEMKTRQQATQQADQESARRAAATKRVVEATMEQIRAEQKAKEAAMDAAAKEVQAAKESQKASEEETREKERQAARKWATTNKTVQSIMEEIRAEKASGGAMMEQARAAVEARKREEELAASSTELGKAMLQIGIAAEDVNEDLTDMGIKAEATGQSYQHLKATSTGSMDAMAAKKQNLGNVTSAVRGQVMSWITSYASLGFAERFIDAIIEKLNKAYEAQSKLSQEGMEKSGVTQELMLNLQLLRKGAGGERSANKMIYEIMRQAGTDYRGSEYALAAAQSSGQDVFTPGGMEYATTLAQMKRAFGYDDQSMLYVTKLAQSSGLNSKEGLAQLGSELSALQMVSQGIDPSGFLSGYIGGTTGQQMKGFDRATLGGLYSAMLTTSRSNLRAGQSAAQIISLAQGTNEKERIFGAEQAVRLGVIQPAKLDAAGMAQAKAIAPTAAAEIENEREAIRLEEENIRTDEAAWANHTRGHARTPQEIAAHKADADKRKFTIQKRKAALARKETALASAQAYMSLSVPERLEKVLIPTLATSDVTQQAIIQESAGGVIEALNKGFYLASPEGMAAFRTGREAVRGAKAENLWQDIAGFEETTAGKKTRTESAMERDRLMSQGPGEVYAELLLQRAKNAFVIKEGSGAYEANTALKSAVSFVQTDNLLISEQGWKLLEQDVEGFLKEYPEQAQAGISKLAEIRKERSAWITNLSGDEARRALQRLATTWGNDKENARTLAIQQRKAAQKRMDDYVKGAAGAIEAPATQPTTQPSDPLGPQSMGNTYINYNVGYVVNSPDEPFDLPGRLG